MTLDDFRNQLHEDVESSLIFDVDGYEIKGAFHVTEIKVAEVRSVDCGNSTSAWTEIVCQLLDTRGAGPAMTVKKFTSILGRVGKLPRDASLFFEYAPRNDGLMRFQASGVHPEVSAVRVRLAAQKTQCKALERAMSGVQNVAGGQSCC